MYRHSVTSAPAPQQLQHRSRRLAPIPVAFLLVDLRRARGDCGVVFALLAHATRLLRHRRRESLDLADKIIRRLAQQLLADGRAVKKLLARVVLARVVLALEIPYEVVTVKRLLCLI